MKAAVERTGPGVELTDGDGVEQLLLGEPAVFVDQIALEKGDEHVAAAIEHAADLEEEQAERAEGKGGNRGGRQQSRPLERRRRGWACPGKRSAAVRQCQQRRGAAPARQGAQREHPQQAPCNQRPDHRRAEVDCDCDRDPDNGEGDACVGCLLGALRPSGPAARGRRG